MNLATLPAGDHRPARLDATHLLISGGPGAGKSGLLVDSVRQVIASGIPGDRVLVLTPDRRVARQLGSRLNEPGSGITGRVPVMSYHSFMQELIRRWWPLVMRELDINAAAPEFLPFNLAQFACLHTYRQQPGNLQQLTIREQRLIVQVLSTMNLAAANQLTLDEGWARVAAGLGLTAGDPIIQDALALTNRFRQQCIAAGVMPVDIQMDAAGQLLADARVRAELLERYDMIAIDDLDEFVPLLARECTSLAAEADRSAVTFCPDGGLRWMLGASVERAGEVRDELIRSGKFALHDLGDAPPRPVDWLVAGIGGELSRPPETAWPLHETNRPDEMTGKVVAEVVQLLDAGEAPGEIVLLIPYLNSVVAGELERGFDAAGIDLQIDRRWFSLLDNRESRACLTVLRCVNPGMTRKATAMEVADLLAVLTGVDPVTAQRWVPAMFTVSSGLLREPPAREHVPREVRLLGRWAERVVRMGSLHWQLESLATRVFAPHQSTSRTALVSACNALAIEARRFLDTTPRLGLEGPMEQQFFHYVDSDVVSADRIEMPTGGVLLTTPAAFLTSGRVVRQQCWLDVASPSWWEPPLLLLSNPHAMSGATTGTVLDEDLLRNRLLGRIIRNLSARCTGQVHTFAALTDRTGEPLDGPLYDALLAGRLLPA